MPTKKKILKLHKNIQLQLNFDPCFDPPFNWYREFCSHYLIPYAFINQKICHFQFINCFEALIVAPPRSLIVNL